MRDKITREEWIELTKNLRNRVSAYFNPEQLEAIDEFIRNAGLSSAFDQVNQ